MLLEVKNLMARYGAVMALKDISFDVGEGEIVAMIGPNGAGKSTALNAISGVLEATDGSIDSGQILFEGKNIRGLRTDELVAEGISLVPEGRRVFPTMTVLENLQMGAYKRNDKAAIQQDIESVLSLLPQLKERMKQKAGTLSTGEQQMLAMGRALMLKPKLLLADEPSLGLSPNYLELVFDKLVEINKNGTSILLVEQNASEALEIAHRGYVFSIGEIVLEDTGKNLLRDEKVKKSFLGGL
ncbi:MAG: ABC transporter ATP-binding protein [Planctomycetes bacterium]|nr:ABC transporter ATP-binding protein [Planctomycetota bacterium]MBL7185392.1 ABC transporter ATP-binding protein [Phycisphaerae bacterium]